MVMKEIIDVFSFLQEWASLVPHLKALLCVRCPGKASAAAEQNSCCSQGNVETSSGHRSLHLLIKQEKGVSGSASHIL